ncbi:hypothetical protein MUK42_18806, partial [Musa troglodytarum]
MLLSGIPFFFLTLYAVANEPHGLVRPDVQVSPVGRLWGPAVGGLDQEGGWLLGAEAVPPRFLPRSRDLVIQVGSDGSHPPRSRLLLVEAYMISQPCVQKMRGRLYVKSKCYHLHIQDSK